MIDGGNDAGPAGRLHPCPRTNDNVRPAGSAEPAHFAGMQRGLGFVPLHAKGVPQGRRGSIL